MFVEERKNGFYLFQVNSSEEIKEFLIDMYGEEKIDSIEELVEDLFKNGLIDKNFVFSYLSDEEFQIILENKKEEPYEDIGYFYFSREEIDFYSEEIKIYNFLMEENLFFEGNYLFFEDLFILNDKKDNQILSFISEENSLVSVKLYEDSSTGRILYVYNFYESVLAEKELNNIKEDLNIEVRDMEKEEKNSIIKIYEEKLNADIEEVESEKKEEIKIDTSDLKKLL